MTTEQAVTSATRSGTRHSERPVSNWVFLLGIACLILVITSMSINLVQALDRNTKAVQGIELTIHQHPTKVEVIHTGLPRVAGRAE